MSFNITCILPMIEYQKLGMIEKITGNKIPEIQIDNHKTNTYH